MSWAVITGATGGLGRALAAEAAKAGHDLILSDRPGAPLAPLATEIRALGRQAEIIEADLGQPTAADALWASATAGREIDILVNNAGLGRLGPLGSETGGGLARDRLVMAVNVAAATDLTAHAAAHMRGLGRGRILNVASIAAWTPAPNQASYHASKAYLLSLSRAVREELRGSGVSLTVLCPSPIATDFFAEAGAENVRLTKFLPPLSAARVARIGWRALERGRAVQIAGQLGRLSVIGARLGSSALNARISGWLWSS